MNISNITAYFNQLSTLQGRLEKEDLLKVADEKTKSVLRFLHDPSITTGLDLKKFKKESNELAKEVNSLGDLLDYFMINNTGTDKDIATVQRFIRNYTNTVEEQDFVKKLITKTYKTGCTAKTLNKIYGDSFIELLEIQLAETFDKNTLHKYMGRKFAVTEKYDGHRTIYKKGKFYSRNGKLISGLDHIAKEIESVFGQENHFVLDGELLIKETSKPKSEWFNETSKIVNSQSDLKENLQYVLFDIIPYDEFIQKKSKQNYFNRIMFDLEYNLVKNNDLQYIKQATHLLVDTFNEFSLDNILAIYEKIVETGGEGVMLNFDEPYQYKRTSSLLKVKPIESADLEIIGFEQGKEGSKYEHTLGNLIVSYKGNSVGVGSGLTDYMRDEIWNNQEDYLGKIAEIIYTSESKNQVDNSVSLRFPRFKCIRTDKTTNDL